VLLETTPGCESKCVWVLGGVGVQEISFQKHTPDVLFSPLQRCGRQSHQVNPKATRSRSGRLSPAAIAQGRAGVPPALAALPTPKGRSESETTEVLGLMEAGPWAVPSALVRQHLLLHSPLFREPSKEPRGVGFINYKTTDKGNTRDKIKDITRSSHKLSLQSILAAWIYQSVLKQYE